MPRLLVIFVGTVALIACGGSASTDTPTEPISRVGTYALQTVDAKPLPYPFPDAPGYELTAEMLTLNADNTFTARSDQRFTQGTQVTTASVANKGTYAIDGVTLTLTFDGGQTVPTQFRGNNEIVSTASGHTWVYSR